MDVISFALNLLSPFSRSLWHNMVDINDSIALSISVLALLSIISISLLVCMILVYWRYRSKEKEKTIWFKSPSELRTGWLSDDRKCLVPGTFSAKVIQPGLLQTEDSASVSFQSSSLKFFYSECLVDTRGAEPTLSVVGAHPMLKFLCTKERELYLHPLAL